jgi:hypothetical protein
VIIVLVILIKIGWIYGGKKIRTWSGDAIGSESINYTYIAPIELTYIGAIGLIIRDKKLFGLRPVTSTLIH